MIDEGLYEWRDVHSNLHHILPKKLYWLRKDNGAWGSYEPEIENYFHHGPMWDLLSSYKQWFRHVNKFGTVIQAGGNCGMYASFYSKFFNKVISFEANPHTFHALEKNLENTTSECYNYALNDRNVKVKLNIGHVRNTGSHHITNNKLGQFVLEVDSMKIDDLNLSELDLIHLDLENYERHAIRGARDTIEKFKPIIISEMDVFEELASIGNGYELYGQPVDYLKKNERKDFIYLPL